MNIILVSGKLAKAKTITLGFPHLLLLTGGGLFTLVVLTLLMHHAVVRYGGSLPYFHSLLFSGQQEQHERAQSYLQDNLNAMAIRLGQMQAQLLRLDTLGERLARLAGFKPHDLMFGEPPGQGGAVSALPARELTLGELGRQIELLTEQLADRGDRLGILDSLFTVNRAKQQLIPTLSPIEGGWHSSNYGWRIDPFSGQRAFHEGIDFMAEQGTPIRAAAGGIVSYSDFHPQYGNMIEIDHGNGLVTRYAHASKRAVNVGDVVLRGAKIAEVGRTGRATGTHLHFEVRRRGAPQDPTQFLRLPS